MESEKFNPIYPIGKTVREAVQYFEKFNIGYSFENDISSNIQSAIATIHKEGTHLYKCYNYNITNPDYRIITSFNGVADKPLNSFVYNSTNNSYTFNNN